MKGRPHTLLWPEAAPSGVTDVQFHRVICSAGSDGVGVELRAGPAPLTSVPVTPAAADKS